MINTRNARAPTSTRSTGFELELELELIQTHMTQKPVLRVEAGARALRMLVKICVVGQKGQVRVCKELVCGRGSLARRSGRDGYVTG